jgi:hypothetical protein
MMTRKMGVAGWEMERIRLGMSSPRRRLSGGRLDRREKIVRERLEDWR